ncbi:SGNH/GDSL hydrolase family protein [Burkholderia vietnamiensis]|uniref:SGNH/GDSL hydrolase family protein n=1 Tax=Burkholderia vietnamiensis TaxID=60552 RepID=UPI00158BB9FF|nr:SGNH/GDSL hydrolase family protein [Burkholderia vietnamiensis]
MTYDNLSDAVNGFKADADRVDTFVNGAVGTSYTTTGGQQVPSLQTIVEQIEAENVIAETQTSVANAAQSASTAAAQAGLATAASLAAGAYTNAASTTVPSGIANGANYWVASADGYTLDLYQNNGGMPLKLGPSQPSANTVGYASHNQGYLYALKSLAGKMLMGIRWDGTMLAKLPLIAGKGVTLTQRADGMLVADTLADNSFNSNGFLGAIKTPGGKRLGAWRWDGTLLSKLPLRAGSGFSVTRTADEFYQLDTLQNTSKFVGGVTYAEVTPAGKLVRGVDSRGVPIGKVQHHEAASYATDGTVAAWVAVDPFGSLQLKTQDAASVVRTLSAVKNPTAVQISSGKVMFFGTISGEAAYWYCAPDGTSVHRVMPRSSICCNGDSLTDGSGKSLPANAYPQRLAVLLGRAVVNNGVPGNNSASIAARQGGYSYTGVVAGNTIPVSGGVTVSGYSIDPLAPQTGSYSVRVFLNGIDGTITRSNSVDTFVPTTPPANPVTVPNPCPIVANPLGMDEWIQIIWTGANDGYDMTKIGPAIAAMIANLKPITKRFAVISLTLKNSEIIGTAGYNACMAANAALQAAYPNNYIDVNTVLINSYNPNIPQDVIDHANGTTPSSLHSDDRHFNDAGYLIIAQTVQAFILSKGW